MKQRGDLMLGVCLTFRESRREKKEEKKEFEKLIHCHKGKMYGYVYNKLHSRELAEEVVWDTFFALSRSYEKLRDMNPYQLEAYIFISLRNMMYRKFHKEQKHIDNEPIDSALDMPDFDAEQFENCDYIDLANAVKQLAPKYQSVITYIYYYNITASEAADIMGVSRSTVYNYLREAMEILHRKLKLRE